MNRDSLADLRQDYRFDELLEQHADPDPLRLFEVWLQHALEAQLHEPNAMAVATVDSAGRPSLRMVLLKGCDARGLCFYTNYQSRKGRELEHNCQAALLFWWDKLERQVRIEGRIERVEAAQSDAYYATRPRGSRLAAWASPQSAVLPSRAPLEARLAELELRYPGDEIPRPPHWGGLRLVPESYEFWQGRPSRLHDRLLYQGGRGAWTLTRLAP